MLQTLEIDPKSSPKASVIWLHGLGADGNDFVDIVPELNLPLEPGVRFVFPHAPIRPVAYAGGANIRAWFDVVDLKYGAKEDEDGIKESQDLIEQLILNELKLGIPSSKIVLAGFSQGGAMALQCGLRYAEKLAGILVLSAWLPLKQSVLSEKNVANQKTPILMLHGTDDELVPLAWAKESYEYLQEIGYDAKLVSYSMAHQVCPEEILAIGDWLREILS